MDKIIEWDNGKKELDITTWMDLTDWVFLFGIRGYIHRNTNTQELKWTAGLTINFLCFGFMIDFYSWRKGR